MGQPHGGDLHPGAWAASFLKPPVIADATELAAATV